MAIFDLPAEQVRAHTTATPAPDDLVVFWSERLASARHRAHPPRLEPVQTGLSRVATHDVWFTGDRGDEIAAWYRRPAGVGGDLPVIVQFQGYGGGRGLPHQVPFWVGAGYAVLVVDTRGQGSGHTPGDTPDPVGSGPAGPGFLTRGLAAPAEHYYARVHTDGVLAVDAVAHLPQADPHRVVVAGVSQGGGIAIAVAALHPGVAAALPDVPFLCDIRRGAEICDTDPYAELRRYLAVHRGGAQRALRTLSYVDAAVLAPLATAPALFSVALMDPVCPPSTVYAAYNAWGGAKAIVEYPWNGHEGGGAFHEVEQLRWLADVLEGAGEAAGPTTAGSTAG